MSRADTIRGGAAVGYLTELDQVQAGAVRALRLWADGSDSRMVLRAEFEAQLGSASALHALESFDEMYQLCARFGRRPLMRHGVDCRCLGGDEAGFANFIAVAAEGDREEAMWIATTLVRADAAPVLVDLALTFALYLSQLAGPVFAAAPVTHQPAPPTSLMASRNTKGKRMPSLKQATSVLVLSLSLGAPALAGDAPSKADVLANYADIAQAKYEDSLTTAKALKAATEALIANPSDETLAAARAAWIDSRVPYQQTEVYRFGNAIVDDWEGKVNAWPLDEGLIDYVGDAYGGPSDENALAVLNVVANPSFELSGKTIDASAITPELLAETLHEADGVEANVATGYHAIEFLLWGQDNNGHGPGAGERPASDFAQGDDCTGGNCDRRAAYLSAATDLLISDLEWMTAQWSEGGEARETVLKDENAGITAMLTGMGSLSYGEQAGERMRLGLMLNDPEEEHDCFSDNTHNSHYYDGQGVQNVYLGSYTRVDGSIVEGASLSDLVKATDADLDAEMIAKLSATMQALGEIKTAAEGGFAYDQMLEQGNAKGEALIMGGVNGLIDQTRSIERVVAALELDGIAFEGSDSLDNPSAVFE